MQSKKRLWKIVAAYDGVGGIVSTTVQFSYKAKAMAEYKRLRGKVLACVIYNPQGRAVLATEGASEWQPIFTESNTRTDGGNSGSRSENTPTLPGVSPAISKLDEWRSRQRLFTRS